ncbi:MAG: C-type lectin domain-containing protein [Kordiimonas sp.]
MFLASVLVAATMMFQGVDDTGTAVARPIGDVKLEPTTGSYFQMFEFYGRPPHTWEHAQRMVRGYRYKEREGRLAHVKTGAVHYFLLLNFLDLHSNKAWIGLSATCDEKAEIEWLDGSKLADQSFRAWNDGTARNISRTCKAAKLSGRVMPVFYDSHELGLRWEVNNEKANLKYMMVEFPELEDEPVEGDAENADENQPSDGTQ